MSNRVYDILKWVALIALPAFGVLYLRLSDIWAFPYGVEVSETVNAVDACLGILLGISTLNYNKGSGNDAE